MSSHWLESKCFYCIYVQLAREAFCRSELARDAANAVCQMVCVDMIASKLAPTGVAVTGRYKSGRTRHRR